MGQVRKRQSGFSAVEVVLVLAIVGLISVVILMVYKSHNKKPARDTITKPSATTPAKSIPQTEDTQKATTEVGIGNLTTYLPTGWKDDNKICRRDAYSCYTKTINGTTYVLGFMYNDVVSNGVTGLTVNESINPYDSNSVIKTVTTSKGTTLYIVRSGSQAEGKLVVSSTNPNPTNTVVPYGTYKLGISIGVGTGQSIAGIDFSANGANEIIGDLISIASSLNL